MIDDVLDAATDEAAHITPAPVITWEALTEREPRLAEMYAEISHVTDDRSTATFCANRLWYIQFEPRLLNLVGTRAEKYDQLIRTPEAYTLARRTLYRLLPDCRNCVCVPW